MQQTDIAEYINVHRKLYLTQFWTFLYWHHRLNVLQMTTFMYTTTIKGSFH